VIGKFTPGPSGRIVKIDKPTGAFFLIFSFTVESYCPSVSASVSKFATMPRQPSPGHLVVCRSGFLSPAHSIGLNPLLMSSPADALEVTDQGVPSEDEA